MHLAMKMICFMQVMSLTWPDLSYGNIELVQNQGRSEEEAKETEERRQGSEEKTSPHCAPGRVAMFSSKARRLARILSVQP